MTPARLDILTEGLTALARVIMTARSDGDAAALVADLKALGPARRADIADVFVRARERLARADEPTVSQRVGGPLGEGD